MPLVLKSIIVWALSTALVKILLALGIAFTTYHGLDYLLAEAFGQMSQFVGQLPESLAAIMARFGLFKAFNIIASAMMTVASIKMMKSFVGVAT